jgi:hypothetical protein
LSKGQSPRSSPGGKSSEENESALCLTWFPVYVGSVYP